MNEIIYRKFESRGKVIRDCIHGDIFVNEKFVKVIDSPEFQRLRRIRQLSVADTVFPSANHTRFSHSLGTYHIMSLMIKHFEKYFFDINILIKENEKDIALLAALLHDIGHGPFSHAFENIFQENNKNINHEDWTVKIITDREGFLHKIINAEFGEGTAKKVAELISKQKGIKEIDSFEIEHIDLFSVLSSLVSSQLDADRLDYLLRDSFFSGVPIGKIDVSRIIASLQITVHNNKYFVCVNEKYLPDIETYILSRYQMQKVIYFHDFKIQMEQVIKRIFNRAYYLYENKNLNQCLPSIEKLFSDKKLSVEDYINLDDSVFICAFHQWSLSEEPTLGELCKSFLFRNKSSKINALNNRDDVLEKFMQDICNVFRNYKYEIKNLENEDFWIRSRTDFSAYKLKKENIWIQKSNGLIVDLIQASNIINDPKDSEKIWEDNRNVLFINYNLIRKLQIDRIEELIKDIKIIVSNYDIRKTIEIEKKYILDNEELFEEILKCLKEQKKYKIDKLEEKEQVDYYYDTFNNDLLNNKSTLRIRQKNGENEITIKKPIDCSNDGGQNLRFEFQKQINTNNIQDHKDFISEHFAFLDENTKFNLKLIIDNQRTPIKISFKDILFEMVFDKVIYKNNDDKKAQEYQVEIELKSEYRHRVNLKLLTDILEKRVKGLTSCKSPKYIRGLELLSNEKQFIKTK